MYFTNVVKCTSVDATLPTRQVLDYSIPLLHDEIKIVKPQTIVTFGIIPFRAVCLQSLKLADYYAQQDGTLRYPSRVDHTSVYPCYFPVGRGKRKEALHLLKVLREHYTGR